MKHADLAREIHGDNIAAGWWSDLATGQSIVATRNRPEMMMLVVSELSEADEADGADDKLPEFPGYRVELADAAIRLYDMLGADMGNIDIDAVVSSRVQPIIRPSLMRVVNGVSRAMEAYRKGRHAEYVHHLADTLGMVLTTAGNIETEIAAKREYNRSRLDHKVENRRAAGGKAF